MLRTVMLGGALFATAAGMASGQASVQVEPYHLDGPRELAEETAQSVVRHYIESWTDLRAALSENRPALLDRDFTGFAQAKLTETIKEQAKAGISSNYQDQSHDIRIVFYSPEGSSVELIDEVQYDQQIREGGKVLTTQPVKARYTVVMTPSETRWRVRVFQAVTEP